MASSRARRTPRSPHVGVSTARYGALALVVLAPLLLGAMHPAAILLLTAGAVAFGLVEALSTAPVPALRRPPALAAILLLLAGVTLARGIGSPMALVPDAVTDAWTLWPDLPARASLAPIALGMNAVELAAAAAAIALGASSFRRRRWIVRLGLAVVLAASVTALVGIVQQATGASRILGLWTPIHGGRLITPLAGPFVNANQAGALAGLAAIVGWVGTLSARDTRGRALGILVAVSGLLYVLRMQAWAACAALILSALAAVLAGPILGAAPGLLRRTLVAIVSICLVGGAAAAAWWGLPVFAPAWLDPSSLQKVSMWHATLDLVRCAGPLGYGPESFADVYPSIDTGTGRHRQTWVESMPLGILLHHGLLGGGLVLAASIALPAHALVRTRNPIATRRHLLLLPPLLYMAIEAVGGMGQVSWAMRLPSLLALGAFLGLGIQQTRDEAASAVRPASWALRLQRLLVPVGATLIALFAAPTLAGAWNDRMTRHLGLDATDAEAIREAASARPVRLEVLEAELRRAWTTEDLARIEPIARWLRTGAPHSRIRARADFALAWHSGDAHALCDAGRARIRTNDPLFRLEHPSGHPADWAACGWTDAELSFAWERLSDADALALALADLRANPDAISPRMQAIRSLLRLSMADGAAFHAERLLQTDPSAPEHWELALRVAAQRRDPNRSALLSEAFRRFPDHPAIVLGAIESELATLAPLDPPDLSRLHELRERLRVLRASDGLTSAERRQERLLSAEAALQARLPAETLAIVASLSTPGEETARELRLRMQAEQALFRTLDACRTADRLRALAPSDREANETIERCRRSTE
jgi:hypothetical protein